MNQHFLPLFLILALSGGDFVRRAGPKSPAAPHKILPFAPESKNIWQKFKGLPPALLKIGREAFGSLKQLLFHN